MGLVFSHSDTNCSSFLAPFDRFTVAIVGTKLSSEFANETGSNEIAYTAVLS